MKATGLAKAPYISSFYWAVTATVMSTDMSQVDVTLFPSFLHFSTWNGLGLIGWSLLPDALRPFKIYCAPPTTTYQLVLFLWQTVEINPLGHLRVYQICSSESAPFFRRAH